MKKTHWSFAFICSLSILFSSCGGGTSSATPKGVSLGTVTEEGKTPDPADTPLALDKRVRTGILENGLKYFVLAHKKPEQRANLWLAVNAGSVLEDDDQQGLAHFLEHMAFNGTAKYQKMAIVEYLESIGMKFGADINAYTSFDETVYMLQVPTDDSATVTKGLDILHQWAGFVSFDSIEVDKERGVVLEEWRLGQGAEARIFAKQAPILFANSQYAERLPIGKPEILKNAPVAALKRFYQDWYRPNLMAVVAVGDFDAGEMEKSIRAKFAGLKNPETLRERKQFAVPTGTTPMVSIERDHEQRYTTITIQNHMKHRPLQTEQHMRRLVIENLYHSMFNLRLREIGRSADSPLMYAYSTTASLVRSTDSYSRFAVVKSGGVERGLKVLAQEVRRVEQHGFTEGEFQRAKADYLRQSAENVTERGKRDGQNFAGEILRLFLNDETMPGPEVELEIAKDVLSSLTIAELNAVAGSWGDSNSRVIAITGPTDMKAPTKAQVLALLDSAAKSDTTAYLDNVAKTPLFADIPTPGKIVATKVFEDVGVTEWTLGNGAKVIVKPTDFKNDEVQFLAFSPGGTSLASNQDFRSAQMAATIAQESGVNQHNATQLAKELNGKKIAVTAFIDELEEGLRGQSSSSDVSNMLQLIHLRIVASRKDDDAFASWKSTMKDILVNRQKSPETRFWDAFIRSGSNNHIRRRPFTVEQLQTISHDKAMRFYRDRFADAGDFQFVFVGNIDLDTFKPLVETYLATLPSTGRKESWKDIKVRAPKGRKRMTVNAGDEPKSTFAMVFHGPQKWSPEARNNIDVLASVLNVRLREVLREDMGGVYGVHTEGTITRRPKGEYSVVVTFGCAPERVKQLEKAIFDTISDIKKNGVAAKYLQNIVVTRKRERESAMKRNRFWVYELSDVYRFAESPSKILDTHLLEEVSVNQLKNAAKKYLGNRYVQGTLLPESQ